MRTRRVSVELLRAGPRHNQLLSPLTQYLGVCGDNPAATVTIGYEQRDLDQVLQELSYRIAADDGLALARRRETLDRTGEKMTEILAQVPGWGGALSSENESSQALTHLRIVLSASELAMLPFEVAKAPAGAGSSRAWLALQARAPLHDLLGEAEIPADAYWGIHTLRAAENFPITGVPIGLFRNSSAPLPSSNRRRRAPTGGSSNCQLGADAIDHACALIAKDRLYLDQFVVDAVQGGAGTSTNMNANEVVANLALEFLGHQPGEYQFLHPIDDVNMAQSTNDAYPTALRLAVIFATAPLARALQELAYAFKAKAVEFADVLKIGRTQLQDAVPMTLGQEFDAFHTTVKEDVDRLREAAALFRKVNLGATAIGTGSTADPRYASLAVEELARASGEAMVLATNLIEATSDMGAFVLFSGVLKRIAVKLAKICNDLRLLSSGPRAGFGEIRLPPVQAGSSIMPGKVNPVIPEVVSQVAYLVIGHDLTVTLCAEGGQLQLNAFEPTIGFSILKSLRMLTAAVDTLTRRCIDGIEADRERCLGLVESSIGLVTALGPVLGHETCSRIARRALDERRTVADIVLEERLLTKARLDELLRLDTMTRPSRMVMAAAPMPKSA